MNSQFISQQPYGVPPPTNKMSPASSPPGVQNMPPPGLSKANYMPNKYVAPPSDSHAGNMTSPSSGQFIPSHDMGPPMNMGSQGPPVSLHGNFHPPQHNQNGSDFNQYGNKIQNQPPHPQFNSVPPQQPQFNSAPTQQQQQFNSAPPQQPQFNSAPPQPAQFISAPPQQPPQPQFNSVPPQQPPQMQFNAVPPQQAPPMMNQPPPMMGQPPPRQPNQYGPPPMMGQPPQPQTQPFNQYAPNQVTQQMQDLNLGVQKPPFPGGPARPLMNGENGPHMPPPMGQNYLNGPGQMKPPTYPPMPGQPPAPTGPPGPPGAGGYPQPMYQPQQPQKRLDPDQMPSPIQVMQDDQRTRSGAFVTNEKGLVPPLVTTKFVVQDQGNASPRFIRSTMYNVPVTQDLMKQTAVPFGVVISPMARTQDQEFAPPIINFGELGPVRCIRCKAYMCPFMQFIDSGRRFQCLFCKAATEVPAEYFQHLDHTGQRMDRFERPELVLGTYEFTATKDYCRNNNFPKPPAIIFLIDVSYNNMKSGLVNLLCAEMKNIIKHLPVDQGMTESNMRVGFITYSSTVHFYNIKGSLAAPQMMVVGDVQDMFMPLLDGFLGTPSESEAVIDSLMEQIPKMFGGTRETETVLLPAILAGLEALRASDCAGKLIVFHSTLPIAEAPGKLKNRDDRKLLSTEKERTILTPQTQAYNQLGQDCVGAGCCVDLFLFNNAYIDVATIGQVARLTGGEIFKYTYFQADLDGERLINDVITNINKKIAFDSIMRVRTSTGIRPTDFYGHFFMSNTTDMEIAAIDCDKAVAIEIKHDDKLTEEEGVYIQVALLYTSCSGQRRLRIINLSLKTCSQMADLYRSCDLDTLINFFAKQSIYKLLENNPKAVKENIVNRAAQILANYRKNCASPSSAGQLILPECMKLMPLYINCLLKNDALSGGSDMTVDDRSYVMQAVMTMTVPNSVSFFYPRLIPLHDLQPAGDGTATEIPPPVRCSIEKMIDQGVYLLENGIHMMIWIGLAASQDFCQQVFGVQSPMQIDVDKVTLPQFENPLSQAIHSIIQQIRKERHRYMRLTLVRQREKLEPVFKHFLVEDRGLDNSQSYVDFLCHMHKEIRTILS